MTDDDPRQEPEVVLDDAGQDGLRGDVDHSRAGLAQQQEKEKESLLIGLHLGAFDIDLGGERRQDDDGLLVLVEGANRRPQRNEFLLQQVKSARRLLAQSPSGGSGNVPEVDISANIPHMTPLSCFDDTAYDI